MQLTLVGHSDGFAFLKATILAFVSRDQIDFTTTRISTFLVLILQILRQGPTEETLRERERERERERQRETERERERERARD